MSTYFNGGFYGIRGNWSSFYRRFILIEELNKEWTQINEEIWTSDAYSNPYMGGFTQLFSSCICTSSDCTLDANIYIGSVFCEQVQVNYQTNFTAQQRGYASTRDSVHNCENEKKRRK
uniref:Uncharacterized protein n=1 Tax=Glossina austeni TaxID=7395 RepID=A0A1A9VDX3_GLOAU